MSTEKNGNGLSDVSKSGFSFPMLLVVVPLVLAGAGAFYALSAKQAQFDTALAYERQLDDLRTLLTKEQIENAGLRNSAMLLSTEASRCNDQLKGR